MSINNPDNSFNNEMLYNMLENIRKDLGALSDRFEGKIDKQGEKLEKVDDKIDQVKLQLNDQINKTQTLEANLAELKELKKYLNNNSENTKSGVLGNLSPEISLIIKLLLALVAGGLATLGGSQMMGGEEINKKYHKEIQLLENK